MVCVLRDCEVVGGVLIADDSSGDDGETEDDKSNRKQAKLAPAAPLPVKAYARAFSRHRGMSLLIVAHNVGC
jgi:hypothetical protein